MVSAGFDSGVADEVGSWATAAVGGTGAAAPAGSGAVQTIVSEISIGVKVVKGYQRKEAVQVAEVSGRGVVRPLSHGSVKSLGRQVVKQVRGTPEGKSQQGLKGCRGLVECISTSPEPPA